MSLRLTAGAVATAALLALPAAASARPDYQFDAGAAGVVSTTHLSDVAPDAAPVEVASDPVTIRHDDDGAGTVTVLAVAGGTLLAGAAAGFGGAQMAGRRQLLRP